MLEPNNIYLGDCLELMKQIPDKSIDLVLTDPPYGIDFQYDGHIDDNLGWIELMKKFIPEALRVGKIVIFPSTCYKNEVWLYNNFPAKWRLCWYKGSPGHASPIGFCDWEMILIYGDKIHRNVHDYFYAKPTDKVDGHPCPKSIDYNKKLLSMFANENDLILDAFLSPGTTAIACYDLKMRYIGIEKEPKYFDIAKKRISEFEAQQRLF